MQLEDKLINLIKSPDKENRDLGYGMIHAKLSVENVIFWYYTVYSVRAQYFYEATENRTNVTDRIIELTRNIAYSNPLDLDKSNQMDAEAMSFIKVHFDKVSPKSILTMIDSISYNILKKISTNFPTEVLMEKENAVKLLIKEQYTNGSIQ
jgi:hypothetical protein